MGVASADKTKPEDRQWVTPVGDNRQRRGVGSRQPRETGAVTGSLLQMRKVRAGEVRKCVQSYTAMKEQGWDLNLTLGLRL